ncbi:MAG: hypothetical protein M1830_003286 [Pleopsidium flavum]|nr:MAG: hypothetical protein M1830_003286 [Pleopsidium flavum]
MRIFIIGGSGRTGKLIIDEALDRGHTVTALVREPSSLQARHGLTVVKGTPLRKSDIEDAFNATQVDPPASVIVALNASRASDNPWAAVTSPPRLMADSHANAVAVMKEHGIRKIATMAALGVGDSLPNLIFIMRWVIKKSNMLYSFEDHNLVDQEMKKSGMDYVLARPTRLTIGEAKPVKSFGNSGQGVGMSISRKSVAVFLVDAVEKSTWDRTTPVISN